MKQQLVDMLQLQDKMNSKVHPQWREQNFAWYRAVWTECAELLDHHGWKWWKAQTPDIPQIQLEIVDIWHFGLSILICESNDLDVLASAIESQWSNAETTAANAKDFPDAIEQLANNTLSSKGFSIPLFRQLMTMMDMEFAELYRQYIGKNVLNFFRQDNGYKDGSYIKIWDGMEDNEHLANVIQSLDPTTNDFAELVYNQLTALYPSS